MLVVGIQNPDLPVVVVYDFESFADRGYLSPVQIGHHSCSLTK